MAFPSGRVCLCQDCLKMVEFSQELHEAEGSCACGGDFCGCNFCQTQSDLLKAGKQIQTVSGLRAFPKWTAENGASEE